MAKTPMQMLAAHSGPTAEGFLALRRAASSAGPLDERTCELILVAGFAAAGEEMSFIVHAKRLLALGATREEISHAVLITLGATTCLSAVTRALRWLDALE